MNASPKAVRVAAENLLVAHQALQATREGSQTREVAAARLKGLCRAAAIAGLASSAEQLEVIVADVVEQLPAPAGRWRGDWFWLAQARFLLVRRLDGPRVRDAA